MSIVRKILLGLLILVAALVLIGLFLPSSAHVERSITIEAPPAMVFAVVNGFRSFNEWSPWAERDPETEYLYEGPERGAGAKMSWSSDNPQVGTGSQEITLSEPDTRVDIVIRHIEAKTVGPGLRLLEVTVDRFLNQVAIAVTYRCQA